MPRSISASPLCRGAWALLALGLGTRGPAEVPPAPSSPPLLPVPAGVAFRDAALEVRVGLDHSDWTYELGTPATFLVSVTADEIPLTGIAISYELGPEMMPAETRTATIPSEGVLRLTAESLPGPGFLRCRVKFQQGDRLVQGEATAAYAPFAIAPTQVDPPDFDAFWAEGRAALEKVPMDARLTLQPELCTARVDVYHVSLQTVGPGAKGVSRLYGMLCEPRGEGPFPAILNVPGAGVRPYTGALDLAEKGAITLQIGIHGIPVNLPLEVYEELKRGALQGYNTFHLADRDRYYYRRVYLGCLRANDFLLSRPRADGRLVVMGGSQGGQLSLVTAALDPRVQALSVMHPAYCDVTGYLHGRAGGWPGFFREYAASPVAQAEVRTTAYYDALNFARRLRVPGFYVWGYNDTTCPPTSMFAAYNVITAPKTLALTLEVGHATTSEKSAASNRWVGQFLGLE